MEEGVQCGDALLVFCHVLPGWQRIRPGDFNPWPTPRSSARSPPSWWRGVQRDLHRELTYHGLRAAEAKGSKGGRRPFVAAAQTDAVRTAYLEGRSIAALARDPGVSRGAIRTALADLLPDHTATEEDAPAPELSATLDMPGKVADFPRASELEPTERAALDQGVSIRRDTLRVTAIPAVHPSSSPTAGLSTAAS
ncbi:hypothetical protein [Streptomyces cucumeris]|uniref:hypothetical protein n=1 Tax=Streptomyces cucumeris TaxID=2962890 RepID=UPI003D75AE5A